MTNEEAVKWLRAYPKMTDFTMPQIEEALDMAEKALMEQAQADGDIITALCSLPKIQSSDGQDYVQLFDVLETVRRYKPSVAIPNKVGHLENVDTTKSICSICGVVFSITVPEEYNDREVSHCPFCGCPVEIER